MVALIGVFLIIILAAIGIHIRGGMGRVDEEMRSSDAGESFFGTKPAPKR